MPAKRTAATFSFTAASEGEKTDRSVDLLGSLYDWSGATKTAAGCQQGERGDVHQFGVPHKGNANFAWVQHLIHHLAPHGSVAILLANGFMSRGSGVQSDIQPFSCSCG